MAQFKPADHSKGDANTIGGYRAVHDRPAAFEGADGFSYSVELVAEPGGGPDGAWAGWILFVKWARVGAQTPEGHLETDYLVHADSEGEALRALGSLRLSEVKRHLDELIAAGASAPTRRWWDAMREPPPEDDM
jgi:hypothetical protein